MPLIILFAKRNNMSQSYPSRVRDNILRLSVASSLPQAFKEWRFTDHTVDHEEPSEVCGLCDKRELRYHFEIENELTKERLMVGSHCILKFDVPVYEKGELLGRSEARQKLNKLKEEMHREACIRALEKMLEREDNQILRGALGYYKEHGYLTPKYAFVVLWRLGANNVNHTPSFFTVRLNRESLKDDLKKMNQHRVTTIWPALSDAQRKLAIRLGHTSPAKKNPEG